METAEFRAWVVPYTSEVHVHVALAPYDGAVNWVLALPVENRVGRSWTDGRVGVYVGRLKRRYWWGMKRHDQRQQLERIVAHAVAEVRAREAMRVAERTMWDGLLAKRPEA